MGTLSRRVSLAATAAALVLLTGCGATTETERGPVSLAGGQVSHVGPQELVFDVPSCHGDPEVDELAETDDEVRIRIVTTMVTTGEGDACADILEVALEEPLGNRDVIDTESGERLSVVERNADPESRAELDPSDPPKLERENLDQDEFQVLAAAATNDLSLTGQVFREADGARSLWKSAQVAGTAPTLPEGTVGVVVVARDAESTCRSTEDVSGVEIVDGVVVVVLDPDGDFLRPCPGPSGAHAFTAFAVAVPDRYDDGLTGAESRLGERSAGEGTTAGEDAHG